MLAICRVLQADSLPSHVITGERHSINPVGLNHWEKMLFLGDVWSEEE